MDELLTRLEELDKQMILNSDEASSEQWLDFMDQRQQLIDRLIQAEAGPLAPEHRNRLASIQRNEDKLLRSMEAQKTEAANWLQQRGQAKAQRNAYDIVYASDSILMDRRR
ncbi:hypothetical protein J41TS12_00600 [Paenibacillus antibioticophila]|uniref:Flagellar protein FliT n=1 Tax=Paenibacillus antibioticophila TaxID=1274374 RepID=A0A920CFN4_9BACL|nr:hypothetical protein [Paenibacillus antibioticophila]GIO35199.1 hypothetical protein J41TS12_00600 [Paenibacillus antibioticophila]